MITSKQSDEKPVCPFLDSKCKTCGVIIQPKYSEGYTIGNYVRKGEWVEPGIQCKDCYIKEEEKKEKVQHDKWENERFSLYGLSPINKTMTFENFKTNDKNKKIYDFILKYSDTLNGNIFLTGRCGNGKTHLASALAMKLFTTKYLIHKEPDYWEGKKFKFVVIPQLLLEIRDTFKKDSEYSELDIIERYTETPFLFLDDFGAEKISEWTLEAIFLLLDTRIRDMKPFFITSNLSISEIGQRFNDRIASRIAGECSILELTDIDHRLKK